MEELTKQIYKEVNNIFGIAIRKTAKKYNIKNLQDCQILICSNSDCSPFFKFMNDFKTIKNGEDKDKIFSYEYMVGLNVLGHVFKSQVNDKLKNIINDLSKEYNEKPENIRILILTNDNEKAKKLIVIPYKLNETIATKLSDPYYLEMLFEKYDKNYLN